MNNHISHPGEAILASIARLRRLARRIDALCLNVEIMLAASPGNGAVIALRSGKTTNL